MGDFINGKVYRYTFCPPNKYKPPKQEFFFFQKDLHGIVLNTVCLDVTELPNVFFRVVKKEQFAKGTEKKQCFWQFNG